MPAGLFFNLEGKDSWPFIEAGSNGVAMIPPDQLVGLKRKADFCAVAAEYFRDVRKPFFYFLKH